jgi:hypothetical protein
MNSLRGIYILNPPDQPIAPESLANANVDGIAIRVSWKNAGLVAYLANTMFQCLQAGKHFSLSIKAGIASPLPPQWSTFTYVDSYQPWLTPGEASVIPLPWDTNFLNKFSQTICAIANMFNTSTPNTTKALLDGVKITGLNSRTDEIYLPRNTGQTASGGGKTWKCTNDGPAWLLRGYTPALIFRAYQTILGAFRSNFTSCQLSAQIVPDGFSPITGNPTTDQALVDDIIRITVQAGCAVQNNGLKVGWTCPRVANLAPNTPTGYQSLTVIAGEETYRVNNGTPGNQIVILNTILEQAVTAKARWVEIYPPDANQMGVGPILASARKRLLDN